MKKIKVNIIAVVFISMLFSLIASNESFSQFRDRPPYRVNMFHSNVYLDPLVFYSNENMNGRLDFYIEIPVNILQYKYNYSKYTYSASFTYFITIKNITDKIFIDTVYSESMENNEQTQKEISNSSLFRLKHFYLPPDKYNIAFKLKDANSQNEYRKEYEIEIKYTDKKKLVFSNIMLLSDYKVDIDGKKEITPNISGFLGNSKEFYMFFEVINKTDSIMTSVYNYNIVNEDNENSGKGNFSLMINPGMNQFFEQIKLKDVIKGNYKIEITDAVTNELVCSKSIINFPVNMNYPERRVMRNN